jgi:maltooligosyltrehalose trehalohydrolase
MTSSSRHLMPYGATCLEKGVRFRLWAPGESAVAVALEDKGMRVPMQDAGEGWFEAVVEQARAGDRYRYELGDGFKVPDPASRQQADDVSDPSVVVDPGSYRWKNTDWRGRPWHESVLYELHVGTFTEAGTYDGVRGRLKYLVDLGITAIELMPLADFSGRRNWGYDGVLLYAPDASYGTPDQLKALIDEAHGVGLMVFLDVVYNHFGPDGNYIGRYAPQMFTDHRHTPWGKAIDYAKKPVRDFFVHNACYWIEEYRFDGLRLDAVHEIIDDSKPSILVEIAAAVRNVAGDRHVHAVIENDDNNADFLPRDSSQRPHHYAAQWNDDFHHAAHVVLSGEQSGYYADYAGAPVRAVMRALSEGFVHQGDISEYRGRIRGSQSGHLPPVAFVNFLQNHDQVGNRAFGERMVDLATAPALRALSAVLLLAPSIPMLFMGEEWAANEPFCFFVDFKGDLADAVRNGRRQEFAKFPDFADPEARERIPDPVDADTFRQSILDWSKRDAPGHREWLEHYRGLLRVRRDEIVPRLAEIAGRSVTHAAEESGVIVINWTLGDGARLQLVANLTGKSRRHAAKPRGRALWTTPSLANRTSPDLPGWSVAWHLEP